MGKRSRRREREGTQPTLLDLYMRSFVSTAERHWRLCARSPYTSVERGLLERSGRPPRYIVR